MAHVTQQGSSSRLPPGCPAALQPASALQAAQTPVSDPQAASCHIMASLRMVSSGRARSGSLVLARDQGGSPGMHGPSRAAGSCPAADIVCRRCCMGHPGPDATADLGSSILQSSGQLSRPPCSPLAHRGLFCSAAQPGCVLGFVTSGCQAGTPAQAVIRLQSWPARSRLTLLPEQPELAVSVYDCRSGQLHAASARAMLLGLTST